MSELVITFRIQVDQDGLEHYHAQYPGFRADGETDAATFAREAITTWDSEGLILGEPTWEVTDEPT